MKLMEKFRSLMDGRYGADRLYRALTVAWAVLTVAAMISGNIVGAETFAAVLTILSFACLGWMLYRVFSKDISRRAMENSKYIAIENDVKSWWKLTKARVRDIKTHRYRKCPHCHTAVRLKLEKGTHTARCPACGEKFKVKIII